MAISKRIKEMRKKANISQEEMAKRLFISQNALSQYETGKREIGEEMIEKIANELGFSVQFVRTGKGRLRDENFYKPKKHEEFRKMSNEELTDYIMETQDEWFQCRVAGYLPWEFFKYQGYHDRYWQVSDAIVQYSRDNFEIDFLEEIALDSLYDED